MIMPISDDDTSTPHRWAVVKHQKNRFVSISISFATKVH